MSKTALTIDAAQHRSNLGVRVIRGVKTWSGYGEERRDGTHGFDLCARPRGFGLGWVSGYRTCLGRSGAGGQTARAQRERARGWSIGLHPQCGAGKRKVRGGSAVGKGKVVGETIVTFVHSAPPQRTGHSHTTHESPVGKQGKIRAPSATSSPPRHHMAHGTPWLIEI